MDPCAPAEHVATGFAAGVAAVLTQLAGTVPFPMWLVSRKRENDYVVLAAHDSAYGFVSGDVLPWRTSLCASVLDGSAPCATGDVRTVPALLAAAADLRMDVGAYVTVPLRGPSGQLYGTLCGADPQRHEGSLDDELVHVQRAAQVLSLLLEQQLHLERAERRGDGWDELDSRDGLTGVGNRRRWDRVLEAVEEQCASLGSSAVVVCLDLDGLAQVNDELGHAAGDDLLRAAGDVLRAQCRRDDVVARTGGSEFSVLLVDTAEGTARALGERIRRALADVDVDASVGVALRPARGDLAAAWRSARALMLEDERGRAALVSRPDARTHVEQPGEHQREVGPGAGAPTGVDATVASLLREAREALGLSVAFLSRFEQARRVVQAVDASCAAPLRPNDSHPVTETYCQRILDGELPQAIPDTRANTLTAGLAVTRDLDIGSYVGVPVHLTDGSVYGTLCAYDPQPRPVDERDAALLQLVARTLGLHLSGGLEERQRARAVQQRLDEVLHRGLLTCAYQPVVDCATGATVGVEALARFPQHYGLRPDQWFAEAAEAGHGERLELAALRTAAAALPRLPSHVALAVNVSAAVAVTAAFAAWLASVPLDRLVVELTEHERVQDYAALNAALAPARARGLRIAVDDTGAGYSSLRHTLMLKPDLLKLDISLVRDVDTDADKRALCRAVITFAHSTGAQVIAEGVETAAELATVRRLGADQAQGYLVQRPAPLHELQLTGPAAPPPRGSRPRRVPPAPDVLQTIDELHRAGASPATIAARLNAAGDPQANGNRWSSASIVRVLQSRRVVVG